MSNKPYVTAELAGKPNMKSGASGKATASFIFGLASFFCAFLTGIIAIILGILALGDISKSRGRLTGNGFAIAGIVLGAIGCFWTLIMIALLLPAVQQVREAARRTQSMNNIRQVVLSLHNYQSANKSFSPPVEGEGKDLSWRVHILPYLDEQQLYNEFHLDEPWDSTHNLTLVDRMPAVFQNPNLMLDLPPGKTTYLIPTTPASANPDLPRAIFVKDEPRTSFGQVSDGSSNTIMVLEADLNAAVTWTDPHGDWIYNPGDPMHSVGNVRPGVIVVGAADGSVHAISNRMLPADFNALITRDGGEIVQF